MNSGLFPIVVNACEIIELRIFEGQPFEFEFNFYCHELETHVHILACLRARVAGTMFGRAKLQQQLLTEQGMASVFNEVRRKHDLSKGDFPDWQFMARQLQGYDFTEFYKPSKERSQKLKKVCRATLRRSAQFGAITRRNSSARNSPTALTRRRSSALRCAS